MVRCCKCWNCCCPSRDELEEIPSPGGWSKQFSSPEPFRAMYSGGTLNDTVLHRGLGELMTTKNVKDEEEDSNVCTPALAICILGALVTIPCALWIEYDYTVDQGENLMKSDQGSLSAGMANIAAIPLACTAVNFLIMHIRRTTFWWDRKGRGCCGIDQFAWWPMLIVTLGLVRSACLQLFNDSMGNHITFYIEVVGALILLKLYFGLLDSINAIIKGMEREQEEINKAAPVKKMQNLVRNITRTGKPEKDVVYCFAQTNTVPAYVLSFVWWVYYAVAKVLGLGTIIAMFMGVSSSLISRLLIASLLFAAATIVTFAFELGPNALSLFRLSLNKPFYVGDLVTLNTNGAMDTPATSIMGFVENITMMYVVVRNFEMKQTWIPHVVFSRMIIQNWTRRPSKTVLLNIGISCRCPAKKVERLTAFAKRWIEASTEIQQTNYRKYHITKVADGYNLQIIFFPEIGVTHRGIRQKFLVALMAAAERMQIPFVPLQINQNYCEGGAAAAAAPMDVGGDLDSVDTAILDDLMPNPNDRLPKGVGLGFREFPANTYPENANTDLEKQELPERDGVDVDFIEIPAETSVEHLEKLV